MFGPNEKSDFTTGVTYHHRETKFHTLLKDLETVMHDVFGYPDYEFLFITGSGTVVNEIVIASSKFLYVVMHSNQEFGARLSRMNLLYGHDKLTTNKCIAYPLYETSISQYHEGLWNPDKVFLFLDAVSAFPYYLPTNTCAVWTTVSSKQLGAWPVIGIIAIRKDICIDEYFKPIPGSYLNLIAHINFKRKNETLATPAIVLYRDLLACLRTFNRDKFVELVNKRRAYALEALNADSAVIGTGPVLTLEKQPRFRELVEKWNLYVSTQGYQIFLWSGDDRNYELLYQDLRRARDGERL